MILALILVLFIIALGGGAFIYHPLLFLLAIVLAVWLVSAPIEGGRWYGPRRWR